MEISATNQQAPMETSCIDAAIRHAVATPIPTQTSIETSQSISLEASAPLGEAFMENSAIRSRCADFIEKSAQMPNTSALTKPLSHHTCMETSEELPCHRAFAQSSMTMPLDLGEFSANSANSCKLNMKIKKEELSACRKGCPIGRIENSNSATRQVTLCKRHNGLFKKAHELSVLCDADVAAIIVSPSGKISEFASSRSVKHQYPKFKFCLFILRGFLGVSWMHTSSLSTMLVSHILVY